MNELDELQELKSTVARLEAEVAEVTRMTTPTKGGASLIRARRGQRLALWLGTAGLVSLPVLGWAAVSLTEFQSGEPIVAADVNDNFTVLASAVDVAVPVGSVIPFAGAIDVAPAGYLLCDGAEVDRDEVTVQAGV
jgi:hypothetical protein